MIIDHFLSRSAAVYLFCVHLAATVTQHGSSSSLLHLVKLIAGYEQGLQPLESALLDCSSSMALQFEEKSVSETQVLSSAIFNSFRRDSSSAPFGQDKTASEIDDGLLTS